MADGNDPYRELFEHSPDAILVIEGDRFVDCNPAAAEMLRFPDKRALLARYSGGGEKGTLRAHPGEFSPPRQPDGRESFEKADEMMKIAFEQGGHRFEWEHERADGECFTVEVLLTPVYRDQRRVLHVVWREIGERKRLEQELRRAQRLEAVGRLAGGIAHDFNNLLVVILSHAELLQSELQSLDAMDQAERAAEIQAAGERAAALTRQLLTFSRGQPIQPKPTDLVELLSGLDGLLGRLIGEDIDFAMKLGEGPITVKADPSQIEQLVINLCVNARDAMPGGGHLEVVLERCLHAESSELPGLAAGEYAVIRVGDSGEGMSQEEIDRAFEPFFTTKTPGAGSGLGLATVHAIAEQCGGGALIQSSIGQGTSVQVHLPVIAAKPVTLAAPAVPSISLRGHETILVAEDEEAIRNLVESMLSQRGYRVITAADGAEALDLIGQNVGEIDLVITDVVMPRLSGPEMVRRLQIDHPGTKVIFMSGYATQGSLAAIGDERAEILEKPFAPRVLLTTVRKVLDHG
ncbi:MAG: response regulator [Deltaproteobacteria bacterium]|nr:response regulator [Deltaproteobacteria bacterium]